MAPSVTTTDGSMAEPVYVSSSNGSTVRVLTSTPSIAISKVSESPPGKASPEVLVAVSVCVPSPITVLEYVKVTEELPADTVTLLGVNVAVPDWSEVLNEKEVSALTGTALPSWSTTVRVISVLVEPTATLSGPVSAMVYGSGTTGQDVITRLSVPE